MLNILYKFGAGKMRVLGVVSFILQMLVATGVIGEMNAATLNEAINQIWSGVNMLLVWFGQYRADNGYSL